MKDCFGLHGHYAFGSVAKKKSGVGRKSATSVGLTTDLVHWLQASRLWPLSASRPSSTDLLPPSALPQSVIKETTLQVREKRGITIDSDDIPLDDEQTYALFAAGKTSDIHHFHSEGMREKLRALKPDRFSDLVAMEALYRPGIKDLIPELISRKHGQTPVDFMTPELKDILGETYGIIVYHEQLMEIVERIGGFTHGEADRLRKAVGKHQVAVLNELETRFMSGGKQAGFPDTTLENTWAAITSTGHLAFNKSFAICDAWLAYRSAWLKAHYPEEYALSYREIFPEE